ncbi:hypothetical protein KP79_PYT01451 [Mizuhopecten yessoensis]|uniref:C2H2-type domain-containing protein n=1 Tax=Mizuhopecten yessoensis TaxID=6573 RepID=A0A210QBS9_MIZYE|nr:hypothetical protein KP79_PYT01451 [Mizuhopecten yessoensis]
MAELTVQQWELDSLADDGRVPWPEGGMVCPVVGCAIPHFKEFRHIHRHWEQIHLKKVVRYGCPLCNFTQIVKGQLRRHLQRKHCKTSAEAEESVNRIGGVEDENRRYMSTGESLMPLPPSGLCGVEWRQGASQRREEAQRARERAVIEARVAAHIPIPPVYQCRDEEVHAVVRRDGRLVGEARHKATRKRRAIDLGIEDVFASFPEAE